MLLFIREVAMMEERWPKMFDVIEKKRKETSLKFVFLLEIIFLVTLP